tara:strand:- start:7 stop:387 length:381 start_codon:yes stop_codon:yes gene_type:complete
LILFLWFCAAIVLSVFGTDLFFPIQVEINQTEHLYRFKTTRFATGCLLAFAVFRYLAEIKASPSLVIVFYYGVFYLIGGLIFAYTEDVDAEQMYHLIVVLILALLVHAEIKQKSREESGRLQRDYF